MAFAFLFPLSISLTHTNTRIHTHTHTHTLTNIQCPFFLWRDTRLLSCMTCDCYTHDFISFMVHDLLPAFVLLWCNNIFIATNNFYFSCWHLRRWIFLPCALLYFDIHMCTQAYQGWAKYIYFCNWLLFIGIEIQLNHTWCWTGIWIRMSGRNKLWIAIQQYTQKINLISISLTCKILFNLLWLIKPVLSHVCFCLVPVCPYLVCFLSLVNYRSVCSPEFNYLVSSLPL